MLSLNLNFKFYMQLPLMHTMSFDAVVAIVLVTIITTVIGYLNVEEV